MRLSTICPRLASPQDADRVVTRVDVKLSELLAIDKTERSERRRQSGYKS